MRLPTLLLLALLLAGCREPEPAPTYVARVGDEVLTKEEVEAALASLPANMDSSVARGQIIDQWVTSALLAREAERVGLPEDRAFQRLLRENERSLLVSALISRMQEENPVTPTAAEIEAYYRLHQDQLRLLEPFVRIRYLAARDGAAANAARRELQEAHRRDEADSLWPQIVRRYAVDPEAVTALSESYYPEHRLLRENDPIRQSLQSLGPGQISPVLESGGHFHVVQLVERVREGTVPKLEWIREDLAERITVEARKQMYLQQVQRLKTEALASEALDIPNSPPGSTASPAGQ